MYELYSWPKWVIAQLDLIRVHMPSEYVCNTSMQVGLDQLIATGDFVP